VYQTAQMPLTELTEGKAGQLLAKHTQGRQPESEKESGKGRGRGVG